MVTQSLQIIVTLLLYYLFEVYMTYTGGRTNLSYSGCYGSILHSNDHTKTAKHCNKEFTVTEKQNSRSLGDMGEEFRGHVVRISLEEDFQKALCAGTMQNALYIITVAHCVTGIEPSKLIVTAGRRTLAWEQNRSVVSYEIHDGWDPETLSNNLALLKLNDSYVITPANVHPVELGQPDLVNGEVTLAYSTGFGLIKFGSNHNFEYAKTFNQVRAPLVDLKTCNEIYRKLGKNVTKNQICAGGELDICPCTGDDGSPLTVYVLYTNEMFKMYVVGLLSSYQGCGSGVPDLYIELENYKVWIESKASLQCDFNVHTDDYAYPKTSNSTRSEKSKGQLAEGVANAICAARYEFVRTSNIQLPLKGPTKIHNYTKNKTPVTASYVCENWQWNSCVGCQTFVRVKCRNADKDFSLKRFRQVSSRIIGGNDAKPNQHPHQVRLYFQYDDRVQYVRCGGAIYNTMYILTSAYCVRDNIAPCSLTVIVGDHSIKLNDKTEQIRRVVAIIRHEKYLGPTDRPQHNDLAILRLESPLNFTTAVHSALLAIKEYPTAEIKNVELSGWGEVSVSQNTTDILQTITIPIIDDCVCRLYYSYGSYNVYSSYKICTGSLGFGHCSTNDNGNPLTVTDGGTKYLLAIASFAPLCGESPGLATKVSAYREWITLHAG